MKFIFCFLNDHWRVKSSLGIVKYKKCKKSFGMWIITYCNCNENWGNGCEANIMCFIRFLVRPPHSSPLINQEKTKNNNHYCRSLDGWHPGLIQMVSPLHTMVSLPANSVIFSNTILRYYTGNDHTTPYLILSSPPT